MTLCMQDAQVLVVSPGPVSGNTCAKRAPTK